jgi:hypothetical protein
MSEAASTASTLTGGTTAMLCGNCGNEAPDGSRYCNMCGRPFNAPAQLPAPKPREEHRWIYIDLFDLRLPAAMQDPDERSEVVSYVYERFTPFADEGWEWVVHPADAAFTGWVTQEHWGDRLLAGVDLLCRRRLSDPAPGTEEAGHFVPLHRERQLAQNRSPHQPDRR